MYLRQHEKLKHILSSRSGGDYVQVCNTLNGTTHLIKYHAHQSHVTPMTPSRLKGLKAGKALGTYCPQGLVVITCKCAIHAMVQLTFQVPRPPKPHDSNDPIKVERSQSMKSFRDILSSRSGGDYVQVCNILNGTTHLSSATPTKVT